MSLDELSGFLADDELDSQFNEEQVDRIYERFVYDFLTNPFQYQGKNVRIYPQNSRIGQYAKYRETFVHIITREYKSSGGRIYLCERANRIHWIKPILLAHPSNEIYYFKFKDDDNICKEYFWYYRKDYMVVLKDIHGGVVIVTGFNVDKEDKVKFWEKYTDFRDGNGTC
jgi:hypothetical protein